MSSAGVLSSALAILLAIVPSCYSTGQLYLDFTATDHSIMMLKHQNTTETVRLFPFINHTHVFHLTNSPLTLETHIRLLNLTFGTELVAKTLIFALDNRGKSSETEVSNGEVSLFVRSRFSCKKGFIGDHCQYLARSKKTTTTTTTTTTATITTSESTTTTSIPPTSSIPTTTTLPIQANDENDADKYIICAQLVFITILLLVVLCLVWLKCFSTRADDSQASAAANQTIHSIGDESSVQEVTFRHTSTPFKVARFSFHTPTSIV